MPVQLTDAFSLLGEELEAAQAEAIKAQGIELIQQRGGPFEVDLAGLEKANSVTVAVLMSWYRHAMLQQKSIMFVNLSQDLLNIIEFSGLRRLLVSDQSAQQQQQ